MDTRHILTRSEASAAIREGLVEISAIVKQTLGPGGLPVLIERKGQALNGDPLQPLITKDGVTVASHCFVKNPNADLIMQTVKAICQKTNQIAGDGTTTAIVLGEVIILEALKELGKSPMLGAQMIKETLETATAEAIKLLKEEIVEIKNDANKIKEVATISSNGDASIGEIIKKAFEAVGPEGVITVDEGYSAQNTLDIVEGFQIERGAEARDQFFNNEGRTKYEAKDVRVLLYDGDVQSFGDIAPAMKRIQDYCDMMTEQTEVRHPFPPTVVIANSFSQEALRWMLIQNAHANLSLCAVKSPHMSSVRSAMLDDMAALLGATKFGGGSKKIEAAELDDFGECDKVVVDKHHTTFYGGAGAEDEVLKRIDQLEAQKLEAESPYDKSIYADRIASLSGGIAKIGVGGHTELEIKERYHRIEDALNASRAALEEGVIPGGGVTFYKISKLLKRRGVNTVGAKILRKALAAPMEQIIKNIGEDPALILTSDFDQKLLSGEPITYDARYRELVNAYEGGILDPVKVARVALENAISIAGLLVTCGGGIVYDR